MSNLWEQQCDAALDIRDRFGIEKALGYLIGEKFLDLLDVARSDPQQRLVVQDFADRIRRDWQPAELSSYFKNVGRVGALGHVLSNEQFNFMHDAGAVDEGPADWADQQLLLEQARRLILES